MFKRRHLYVLLFASPALLLAVICAAALVAAAAGALWLFVYGDNAWPPVASTILTIIAASTAAAVLAACLIMAYRVGRHEETRPTLNTSHLVFAMALTAVLAAAIVMRVMDVGLGPRDDSLVCAGLCKAEGFTASGMPPRDSGDRTCICFDAQGREATRIPLAADLEGSP